MASSAASFTVSVTGVAPTGFAPSAIAIVRLSCVGSPSRSTADKVKLADGFAASFWSPAAAKLKLPFASTVSVRSDEHTSELQSLMRTSYAVFCLNKQKTHTASARHLVQTDKSP